MASKFARETAQIYTEMYEDGIEPFRVPKRPKSKSRVIRWGGQAVFAVILLAPLILTIYRYR